MFRRFLAAMAALMVPCAAWAESGKPTPWQIGFQDPASEIMERSIAFHDTLLYVVFGVSIFVFLLLVYVCVRFSAKRNPVPSKTSHNTFIEIIWTAVPVLILVLLCIPSMRLLYFVDKAKDPEMTLKVIGYQWYWGYQYPDQGDIAFESYIIPDDKLQPGQLRLLDVDNRVVLPVDTTIRLLLTGADVIHAWAVPALGIKLDAVPGKVNELWVKIDKPGVYYGQCSELCGVNHGFMPIAVEAVSKEDFQKWVEAHKKSAANDNTIPALASAK